MARESHPASYFEGALNASSLLDTFGIPHVCQGNPCVDGAGVLRPHGVNLDLRELSVGHRCAWEASPLSARRCTKRVRKSPKVTQSRRNGRYHVLVPQNTIRVTFYVPCKWALFRHTNADSRTHPEKLRPPLGDTMRSRMDH